MKLKNILIPLVLSLAASCAIAALRPSVPADMEFFMLQGPVRHVVQYDSRGEELFDISFDMSGNYLRDSCGPVLQKSFGCAELLLSRHHDTFIVSYFFDLRGRVVSVLVSDKEGDMISKTDYRYRKSERLPSFRTYRTGNGAGSKKEEGALRFGDIDRFGNWTECSWQNISVARTISYY